MQTIAEGILNFLERITCQRMNSLLDSEFLDKGVYIYIIIATRTMAAAAIQL
jgi:hypothetical protein